jgi:large subunit ribosomal protein L6
MSRVGKKVIEIPDGVTVSVDGTTLVVKGPKATLRREMYGRIGISQLGKSLSVSCSSGSEPKFWGLYRTLLSNMVTGVSTGFSRSLELHGTGYRASVAGGILTLNVGYSHAVNVTPVAGVTFDVDKAGKINVSSSDKEVLGLVSANIRGIRPPEPYHGKGIRYCDEVIVTKVGKSSGKK